MRLRETVKTVFLYAYLLRAQILGFIFLWPLSSWLPESPMFRGLADITPSQTYFVSIVSLVFIFFLIATTNLVLLWAPTRINVTPATSKALVSYQEGNMTSKEPVRWAVALVGAACWILFMHSVVVHWTWAVIGQVSLSLILSIPVFLAFDYLTSERGWLISLPVKFPHDPNGILSLAVRRIGRPFRKLGQGYTDGTGVLPGHLFALFLFSYVLLCFYIFCWAFGSTGKRIGGITVTRSWESDGSTLVLALLSVQLGICVLTALNFFFDRFRIPVILPIALVITLTSHLHSPEHVFFAKPVDSRKVERLVTPRQVLSCAPKRMVIVAAGGGGIQSSGWTAQVLTGLTEENPEKFKRALRVISGVSGGSVGTMFYLGSYPGVWSAKPDSPDDVRKHAMSSFLEDVAWGLVYPDLHGMVIPIPFWGNSDRGSSLEQAFARVAGKSIDSSLLDLNPGSGLPVLIFNATLTDKALPVVFTNSRFPDPDTKEIHRRSIRSFWRDYRLDTRLETAARVSATFPFISPDARPEPLPGMDAFVDGGFFDNSGMYSLMAWLEEAAENRVELPAREILLIQIDAFPEPNQAVDRRVSRQWYDQFFVPMTTVIGVRETGQAARIRYEFPLFAASLEPAMKITRLEFRYRPSPRCALEPPPLSWHLTQFEKDCIAEAWTEEGLKKSRQTARVWLNTQPSSTGPAEMNP